MTVELVRLVPSTDELLLQRCTYLMDVLATAQDEMASALAAADVELAKMSARKLMSVGWLFKEGADRHELGTA